MVGVCLPAPSGCDVFITIYSEFSLNIQRKRLWSGMGSVIFFTYINRLLSLHLIFYFTFDLHILLNLHSGVSVIIDRFMLLPGDLLSMVCISDIASIPLELDDGEFGSTFCF